MRNFFVFILLLSLSYSYGQRGCGTMEVLQQQLQENPALGPQMESIEQHNHAYHQQLGNQVEFRNVIVIPVVFHVIHNGDAVGTNENLSEARILAQLAQLNQDFALLNTDASLIPGLFQPVAADTEIQFCLAQRRPDGTATNGINRVQYTQASWTSGQINSTVKPATIWDRNQYLNVWTVVFGGTSSNLLGYAQFPGGNANTDGVVVVHSSVGSIAMPNPGGGNYARGRTLTHEVGHWLNLRHIWGDATCGNDLVADTPVHQTSNGGCPAFPKTNNCPGGPWTEMTMNYMDYTFDQCMYMFTAGQKNRMRAVLAPGGARFSLNNSPGCIPVGETCTAPTVAQLSATNIGSNSARLNCAVTGVNGYDWRYRVSGTTTWTDIAVTTANFADISGLGAATTYEFQAMVQCGTVWSAWSSSQTFTTTGCTAPTLSQLAVANVTTSSAQLLCTVTGVNGFDWRYRQVGAANWIDLPVTTTGAANISGLSASTTYEFQAMVQCGTVWSVWSVSYTFSTLGTGPCNAPPPGSSSVTEITATSVRFNNAVTGATGYLWRYRLQGTSVWTELPPTTANFTYVFNLTPSTNYEMEIGLLCGTTASAWSGYLRFSTSFSSSVCFPPLPSQLSAANITTSSASLNCSLTGVSSFIWRYRAVGASVWNNLGTTSIGTIALSGLSAATTYEFQVSVQCTNGLTSIWSDSQTFTTQAGAPQTCAAPVLSQLSASGITPSGAQLNCSLTGVSNYTWRYRQVGTSAWTNAGTTANGTTGISGLNPLTNYEFQVSVQCSNGIWSDWSPAQTFTTTGVPCNPPSTGQISATNITAFSARLNASVSGVSAYNWRYRVAGTSSWTEVGSTTANFYDLTNLSAATTYEFQVAVQCDVVWSAWSGTQTFTTLAAPACTAPTSRMLFATNISATSARLNCSVFGGSPYHWRYRVLGASTWITLPTTTSDFTDVSGLATSTNYEFQAAISCGPVVSDWSDSRTFSTLTQRLGLQDKPTLDLFPVPAQDFINLQYSVVEAAPVAIALFDLMGREVLTVRPGLLEPGFYGHQLDLTGLPTGTYTVQLQSGKHIAWERFIKVSR
jgi:chitodextrinase